MKQMKLLEQGKTIELSTGWNQYKVLKADDKFALLKCVVFVRDEDLGDAIICNRQDQEIYIAQFHAWLYEESKS